MIALHKSSIIFPFIDTSSSISRIHLLFQKPYGYHLDLFVLILGVVISSIFGLPFIIGCAFLTVNHIQSLHVDYAEYQRSKVKGVRSVSSFLQLVSFIIIVSSFPAENGFAQFFVYLFS